MSAKPPPLPKSKELPVDQSTISKEKLKSDEKVKKVNKIQKKRKSRFDKAPPGVDPSKKPEQKLPPNDLEKQLIEARKYASTTGVGINCYEAKIPIPDILLQDRALNFVGLVIGPGGQTQKNLQKNLQSRINVLANNGEKVTKESTEGLYISISTTNQQKLDVAVAYMKALMNDPMVREALKLDQCNTMNSTLPSTYFPFPAATIANLSVLKPEIMHVEIEKVPIILGKNGTTIQDAMRKSGALIKVEQEHNPHHPATRKVSFQGGPEQVEKAKAIIKSYIEQQSIRHDGQFEYEEFMDIAQNLIGIVIGKSGETIRNIATTTGCQVQVVPKSDPSDMLGLKVIRLKGTMTEINSAKHQITQMTSKYKTNAELMNKPIGHELEIIAIPNTCVGTLLGKGGESVKRLAFLTNTRVQVLTAEEQAEPGFDSMKYKKVSIRGDKDCIKSAKDEIQRLIDVLAAQSNESMEVINPYSASSPAEQAKLMKKYLEQQAMTLPDWAKASVYDSSFGQMNGANSVSAANSSVRVQPHNFGQQKGAFQRQSFGQQQFLHQQQFNQQPFNYNQYNAPMQYGGYQQPMYQQPMYGQGVPMPYAPPQINYQFSPYPQMNTAQNASFGKPTQSQNNTQNEQNSSQNSQNNEQNGIKNAQNDNFA